MSNSIYAQKRVAGREDKKCITLHAVHGVYEVSTLYSRSGTRNAHECTLRVNACLSRALTRRACNVLRGTGNLPELLFLLAIRADAQSFFCWKQLNIQVPITEIGKVGRYCIDELHAGMHHIPVVPTSPSHWISSPPFVRHLIWRVPDYKRSRRLCP